MSQKRYSRDEKYEILMNYYNGVLTISDIANEFNVHRHTIYEWLHKYEEFGIEGLKQAERWARHTEELKLAAVTDYLSGNYSQMEIILKYKISDKSVLKRWIKLYNGHSQLKSAGKGMNQTMIKGRPTTWEERIQIAKDCLAYGKDYRRSMELYHVSYQQIYQWVKKYEEGGDQALQDMRGKKKTEEKLTPEQKRMKQLEQENERLRAENAFLKKLEEIERRRF